ncbi:tyrosine-type recombinase/integrase [Silicimonas sp. MF1-12-2]|uniref:tyrosine-type recombinase/integrase n=1 Tax=Silicimonas sp. MF1-12-2 TaxID=3384793 RepID=UPI0039B46E9B
MDRIKFTKDRVDAIEPKDRQFMVWDSEVRGFGLRVSPGGAKSYIVQRRVGNAERRITIGRADDMHPDAARKKAIRLVVQFADGIDPVAEKKRQKARTSTLRDAFTAYKNAPKKKGSGRGGKKKARTIRDIEKAEARLSDWLDLPVTEITGDMVKKKHAEFSATSPAQANLIMRYLRAVFNHVMADTDEDDPILKRNPVDRLNRLSQWAPVTPATRHIPDDKLSEWIDAVENGLGGLAGENECRDALLFLLMTGARLGEALGDPMSGYEPLRWENVDLEKGTVTFTDTKNRNDHVLPLPRQLVQRLKERKAYGSRTYVFGNANDRVPYDLRASYARIEEKTGLRVTAHDLRRTFASVANKLDISAYKLKRLTNHVSGGDVTAGYVQISLEDLREAMQRIADFMLSPDRQTGGNIVSMEAGR